MLQYSPIYMTQHKNTFLHIENRCDSCEYDSDNNVAQLSELFLIMKYLIIYYGKL